MKRKEFLRNSLGLAGIGSLALYACHKDGDAPTTTTGSNGDTCAVSPEETEGPYPYPGGEIKNPLNRADVTGGQDGLPFSLTFTIVDVNNNCNPVSGARVDIWHCNAHGYYSGYGNQNGGDSGTQSYTSDTWLRGYQNTDSNGQLTFTTIYPGWYTGRATHIHLEVYVNGTLKKTTQLAFPESISNAVHVTGVYAGHGTNSLTNAKDGILGDSATDLANETLSLTGSVSVGYSSSHTIGIRL